MSTWMLKSPVMIKGSLEIRIDSRRDEKCSRKVETEAVFTYFESIL